MINRLPIEWNHPATWPWPIYAWIAFALAGLVKPAWVWIRKQRASAWSISDGLVTTTAVSKPSFPFSSRRTPFRAEIHYTYVYDGERFTGTYQRDSATENEAKEFSRDLDNKPVTVHVNPSAHHRSTLLETDIQSLQLHRARTPIQEDDEAIALPFGTALLVLFQALSCIGLLVSLWVHIGALFGKHVAPGFIFWALHIGIFVVWIPAVLSATRMVGSLNRRDLWKVLLKDLPGWMRYMVYGFFSYAFVNLFLFMLHAPQSRGGESPRPEEWRAFSGHWMVFYSSAFAIFQAARLRSRPLRKCPNGHQAPLHGSNCPECGQPIESHR